ncbi:MAG: hypothetical protein F7C08_01510, partial [Desulfurococcales archaeon]|nr:hypothetical protein [Desulfurococcales archaeon]
NKFKIKYINDHLSIPRIKLAYMNIATMQKSGNDFKSLYRNLINNIIENKDQYIKLIFDLPIEPNRITVKIKIFERPGVKLSVNDKEILLMLLILGMSFIGVGKAVSRGFGKFKLKSTNINNKVYQRIARLINCINNINNQNINCINNIILDIMGLDPEDINPDEYTVLPCFLRSFTNPNKYLLKIDNYNIMNTLQIIGESTLKNNIKGINNMPVKARGHKIHTWLLGLPRSQKSIPKCRSTVDKTGYVIINRVSGNKLSKNAINKGDAGRHISGLFFIPIIDQRGCVKHIFIIDLISLDVPCALSDKELIHVGISSNNCYLFYENVVNIISLDCEECFDGCISIINMSNVIDDLVGMVKRYIISRGGIRC